MVKIYVLGLIMTSGVVVQSRTLLFFPIFISLLIGTPVHVQAIEFEWPDERVKKLITGLSDGELKTKLESCSTQTPGFSRFSIGHRGAPLQYPEHTKEGYNAAVKMGAGIVECDVTFTKDKALVCRHSQCDLHTSTNILETPLAAKCSNPPNMNSRTPYRDVKCCTSDISLSEFKSLRGKQDYGNKKAATLKDYMFREPGSSSDYPTYGTLLTHAESIELFVSHGVQMIPELKAPSVQMPYEVTYQQHDYAKALVDEYKAAGVPPENVYLQSFNLNDIKYWIASSPAYAKNAVWLDGRYRDGSFKLDNPESWKPTMQELADIGLSTLAPPMWMLLDLDGNTIVASDYARAAKAAGLKLVTWTLERSGPLDNGGGWYYQTVKKAIRKDSDTLVVLHALADDVGVSGVFSDWPATTSYYHACMSDH